MKAILPSLILALLGGAGGYAGWRFSEPSRRWARIHDLLQINQDRPHGAWADTDGDTLWSEVDWFYRRDRDGFAPA